MSTGKKIPLLVVGINMKYSVYKRKDILFSQYDYITGFLYNDSFLKINNVKINKFSIKIEIN